MQASSKKKSVPETEIIDIDISDDDIIIEDAPVKKTVTKKRPFRCLNSDCRTEKGLSRAEEYVRRYFGVLQYKKKRRVCNTCYQEAKAQQDSLIESMRADKLLLAEKLPPPKQMVVLTDSDPDPSDNEPSSDDTEYEFMIDEDKTLEDTFSDIIKDLGLDTQVKEGIKHLEQKFQDLDEKFTRLHKEEYEPIEKELDTVRKNFYDSFLPEIMWKPSLDIGLYNAPTKDDPNDVIAESMYTAMPNLPPAGPLVRNELKPNEFVFSMKYSLFARWVQAQVIEVEKREVRSTSYKIRYNRSTKGGGLPRIMVGRQLAYNNPCRTRIPVGTRVIAKYKDDDPKNTTISGSFYVGIIAEIPTAANKYRYLIFFDDGYAQYVLHVDIRVVTEASTCPWEDVSSDSKEFIKEYLQTYPERPMVRLQKNNYVKTEWNGQWWKALVKEVDGSLVKMYFPHPFPMDGRSEWIYRGSTRLSPLFNKKLHTQAQAEQPFKIIRRRTAAMPGRAIVEYGTFGQTTDQDGQPQGERRAVARKSTAARPGTPPREVEKRLEQQKQESEGFTNSHPVVKRSLKFYTHTCGVKCLGAKGDNMNDHKGLSPLLYPIKSGWHRQISRQKRKTVTKNEVFYVAPCGRRLRSIEEVFRYLLITDSQLEIDCFSFEMVVNVSHEWEPFRKIVNLDDISIGEENVPVSCVNSLDGNIPQTLVYCNIRLPTEHVPLNLDPEFLICCDCTDDCQDKSKCQCWQQTIQSTAIVDRNSEVNPNVGYHYRRLFDQVQSGIYECNTRCKCSKMCLNRVVQHPLRIKLQLFKTARRGWGVRTLHDIPRGGFICVYVGKMLSEAVANEEGKTIIGGDDYYADLDYIETVEATKEGYEEEAENIEDDSKSGDTTGIVVRGVRGAVAASDSTDSDGFYSENEADDPKEDQDFNHPNFINKSGITKRERSARLLSRTQKRDGVGSKSGEHSSDEDGSKSDNGKDGKKDESDFDEEEDEKDEKQRQPQNFAPSQLMVTPTKNRFKSVRNYFGENESVYIMDAKHTGNIGRFLNHSCEPNVFVQNVFVDTHDIRFPWVAFFSISNIRAGSELTWDYNYEVDSVPGKIKHCYCMARKCRGRLL